MHHVIERKHADGWRIVSSVIRGDAEKDRQLECLKKAHPDSEFKVTSWRADAALAR